MKLTIEIEGNPSEVAALIRDKTGRRFPGEVEVEAVADNAAAKVMEIIGNAREMVTR